MQVDNAPLDDDDSLLRYFDTSQDTFPWIERVCRQIETRRSLLSDILFFDILLSSGGIREPSSLYPPADTPSLRNLLRAIENSNYDVLKKDCLVYFLLKWHCDGREVEFADERCIPPQFSALSDAYWHLDTGTNIERAVSILSDARLNKDFASKILEVISLTEDSTPLILRYVRTSRPLLTEPNDIDKYTLALAEVNFMEAWEFQRSFSGDSETQPRLIQKLLNWCLTPKPREQPLKQLLAYPFSPREQSIVHSYALKPPNNLPAASIPVIHDLVCGRLIQSGQFAAAIKLDRQFTLVGSRLTERGQKSNQDRRQMMDEIMAIMPSIERELLESELNQFAQGKDSANMPGLDLGMADSWISVGNASVNDLSMSWEHVRPNKTSALPHATSVENGSAIHPSGRAGASRFVLSRPSTDPSLGGHPVSSSLNPFPPIATNRPPVPPLKVSVSTLLEPSTLSRQSTSRSGQPHPAEVASLFDSIGSANQTRNAFYEPPPVVGLKRNFAQDKGRHAIDAPLVRTDHMPENEEEMDADIDMLSDDNRFDAVPLANVSELNNQPTSLFPCSVFGPSSSTNGTKPSATDTKPRMPPGAFMSESEDELEPQTTANGEFPILASPPPSEARSSPRSSRPRSNKGRGKNDLANSIPGSLFYEETDVEEEDAVAPLPSPKRPQRKTRTVTRNKNVEEQESSQRPIRRSSRLSTAPSLSPERLSPSKPKPKKGARTLASAATATKSSGRRKR